MEKLKVGIVETGWVSGEHMAAYNKNPHTELVAVCGRTKESAEKKLCEYGFNIELFGSKGTIRNNRIYSHKFPGQTDYALIPTILPNSGDVKHHPFEGEIDYFVNCILNDKRPFPDIEYAAITHKVIFAADIFAKEEKPVKLNF